MLICMCCLLLFFRRIRNPYAFDLVVLVFLFLLTGCASTAQKPSKPFRYKTPNEVERQIRSYVMHWEGTPHRLGGTDRNGVDCSAFVMLAYNNLFDVQLPRSTSEQIKLGRHIPKRNLQAGDIVFFLLPRKKRHVGIYLSKGEFSHVSSSKGVTISNLHDSYWRRAYWTARRILPL
jgi:cell wall-associated NlpC family hydrolase